MMSNVSREGVFMLKKIGIGFGILVVIGIIASAGGTDTTQTESSADSASQSSTEAPKEAVIAKLKEAVRDGKFEFVATSFECGATTLGSNEFLQEDAQGQFCVLDMTVKNIGSEAQLFSTTDQKLISDTGASFSVDEEASYAISESYYFEEINPGNTLEVKLAFDVPTDASITKVELHDSAFSDGTEVSL